MHMKHPLNGVFFLRLSQSSTVAPGETVFQRIYAIKWRDSKLGGIATPINCPRHPPPAFFSIFEVCKWSVPIEDHDKRTRGLTLLSSNGEQWGFWSALTVRSSQTHCKLIIE